MKIQLKLSSQISNRFNDFSDVTLSSSSLQDLFSWLREDLSIESIFSESGLRPFVRLVINGKMVVNQNSLELNDGDKVQIVVGVSGG